MTIVEIFMTAEEKPRPPICPRCRERPRYVTPSTGRIQAYCAECRRVEWRNRRKLSISDADLRRMADRYRPKR